MEEFDTKFISTNFVYEKIFDTPQRVQVLREILEESKIKEIISSNENLLTCNCGLLLSREQEYHLFRKYNYLKYRISKIIGNKKANKLKIKYESDRKFKELIKVREILIKCNTRLIVKSVLRHCSKESFEYEEFFSNGYMHLLRAIDCFDYTRKFKFSTYFVNVLYRNLLKDKIQQQKNSNYLEIEKNENENLAIETTYNNDKYNKEFVKKMLDLLNKENKSKNKKLRLYIIKKYYGICEEEKKDFVQLAKILKMSKSRIQQINKDVINQLKNMNLNYDPLI